MCSKGINIYYQEIKVDQITTNPIINDGDFLLEGKPGMLIEMRTDYETKNSDLSVFKLKSDGEKIQTRDPARRKSDQYAPPVKSRAYRGWTWGIWAGELHLNSRKLRGISSLNMGKTSQQPKMPGKFPRNRIIRLSWNIRQPAQGRL